jgi:hypothetical protein
MLEFTRSNVQNNETMLSIEQLRSFLGMEKYSDEELSHLAVFLKDFSLILYDAYSNSTNEKK